MESREKYLTFTPWQGDLNNTRMCFETALALAYLSGRQLVMPGQYRQENEPEVDQGTFRPPHPSAFYDIDGLANLVPVISCDDYEQVKSDRPSDRVDVRFDPGTTVFCFPRIPAPSSRDAASVQAFAVSRQGRLEMTPEMDACRCLHVATPMLEHFYTFFHVADPCRAVSCKQMIRDHVRFREPIVSAAKTLAAMLGAFSAVHVRRKDFLALYPEQDVAPDRLLGTLRERVVPGSRLYVATDETDERFFANLDEFYDVYFADRVREYLPESLTAASLACVEQEVCAAATLFIGTRLSTFSGYITRLRGYRGAVETGSYFTDGTEGSEMDDCGAPPFSWTNWVRRGNPLWGREFREAWDY
jgi:hypothetical protein